MGTRLFGLETEYGFSAFDPDGNRLEGGWAAGQLMRLARTTLTCLPAHSSGVFLGSGARFMIDVGDHPEWSTPECTCPGEGVRYARAGDRIVERLASELVATEPRIGRIVVTRCNVDYASGSTFGAHESYLHRGDPAVFPHEIIPHFVSRLVYTGAGGFDTGSNGGAFLLSPRVAHLVAERSRHSTSERGIFHEKDESLAGGGYHRLHVLCGESTSAPLTGWLKLGVTALVVALIEAGGRPGRAVRLVAPVEAMRTIAADPTCRVAVALHDGRTLSALEIQRHYLKQVEANLGAAFMPTWAAEVCRAWRTTLDDLERGPEAVATRLDWAIKWMLVRRHAERRGFAWETMRHWTELADELAEAVARSGYPGESVTAEEALRLTRRPVPEAVARLTARLADLGLAWPGLRPFLDLRQELYEIDTRFAQLGPDGIFARLERAGLLDRDGPTIGDVAVALDTPPARGRARLRGEAVQALARRRPLSTAEWSAVWDRRRRRTLDLHDPFVEVAAWNPWPPDAEEEPPWLSL